MKNESVVWGIIGCGDVAEVKSGPAFQKCENSKLLAVMRRDANLAQDFAKRHQVPLWYSKAEDLLSNKDINAVYIATPPFTHLNYTLQALKAGKDVYLEKPMVLSLDEANVLTDAVSKSKNKLVVAHYRRFLPMYLKVKSLLDANTLGRINYVDIRFLQPYNFNSKSTWRLNASVSGGGYFHDIGPHQLDLMYYFFGSFNTVKGMSINQTKRHDVDDMVNGLISFDNDVQFRGIWSFDINKDLQEDNCTIYGENGIMKFSFYEDRLDVISKNLNTTFEFENPENIQLPMIQETVNYFLGKRDNPCSVEAGREVSLILDAFTVKK